MKNKITSLIWEFHSGTRSDYAQKWGGSGKVKIKSGFSRLYALESGLAKITTGSETFDLIPGRIFLIPCGTEACYQCLEPMTLNWIHLNIKTRSGVDIFYNKKNIMQRSINNHSIKQFNRCLELILQDSPASIIQAQAIIAGLLDRFIPQSWDDIFSDTAHFDRFQAIIKLIHDSPQHQYSVKELAKKCNMHPVYFSRLFKRIFKTPPKQYIISSTMAKASAMLQNPDQTIAETAYCCGYDDPYHFSRAFKKYSGLSPANYRKQSLQ